LDGITYENHNGIMMVNSNNVHTGDVYFINSKEELTRTIQEFSKEAEQLLSECSSNSKEIEELKKQIAAFCVNAKKESPEKNVCSASFDRIKAMLSKLITNAGALKTLFELGEKIVGLL